MLTPRDAKPRDARDVEDAVRAALAADRPVELVGRGTKRGVGHAMATHAVLDLSALDAVIAYEPAELVLTAQPGMPLDQARALLARQNQELAFEPMDGSALLGVARAPTLGGAIASGLSGPRRIKAGAARDHVLGLGAVSGFGESFKAGGRVVKNVTGYDLSKLVAGSWGTLVVMTELTVKVLPAAETETTLALQGLDDAAAARAMTAAIGSPYDVSGAAHGLRDGGGRLTLVRLEGIAESVVQRVRSLTELMAGFGPAAEISGARSRELWLAVREVTPFAAAGALGAWPVWRVIAPPSAAGEIGGAIARATGGELLYDWAGGLIWAAVPPAPDAHAGAVRGAARRFGGHATLIRADDAVKAAIDVFEPLDGGLGALHERVRMSFDPKALFNRGRLERGERP